MRKIGAFIWYQKLHFNGWFQKWSGHTPLRRTITNHTLCKKMLQTHVLTFGTVFVVPYMYLWENTFERNPTLWIKSHSFASLSPISLSDTPPTQQLAVHTHTQGLYQPATNRATCERDHFLNGVITLQGYYLTSSLHGGKKDVRSLHLTHNHPCHHHVNEEEGS